MIPETIELKFDPKTATKETQDIFSDDLARTIWLAVRYKHVVSQDFNAGCLECAKAIRRAKQKDPLTAWQLFRILSDGTYFSRYGIISEDEQAFAVDLLPFVNGEKTIKFEVILS